MITPIAPPASRTAYRLAEPSSLAKSDGKPNTPLPIIELITSAAMLQRPMARIRVAEPDSGIGRLYHKKVEGCEISVPEIRARATALTRRESEGEVSVTRVWPYSLVKSSTVTGFSNNE